MIKTVIILSVVIGFGFVGLAHADLISIIRSDSCIAGNCIPLEQLVKYDNSTQYISGKIVFDEKTGDYVRMKGMRNSIDYYKNSKDSVVFVLPDESTIMRTKKVIIAPHLQEYVLSTQKNKKQIDSLTDVRYTSAGMYANSGCTEITIGIKQVNIDQALAYIAKDCPLGETPILNKIITNKTQVVHCGNDCQYKKFLKEAKLLANECQFCKVYEKVEVKGPELQTIKPKHWVIELVE